MIAPARNGKIIYSQRKEIKEGSKNLNIAGYYYPVLKAPTCLASFHKYKSLASS